MLQNGQPLFIGDINGQGDTESFTAVINVTAAEPIDFAVGPNGNFFFDTTFVDARITRISSP